MYTIELSPNARKGIRRLPRDIQSRVREAIDGLEREPRPHNVVKMRGFERRYRIRIRDYRIVYEIHDDRLLVLVMEVGHRRYVYR